MNSLKNNKERLEIRKTTLQGGYICYKCRKITKNNDTYYLSSNRRVRWSLFTHLFEDQKEILSLLTQEELRLLLLSSLVEDEN